MDDEKVTSFIRKTAQGQTPDAWGKIERRLKTMDAGKEKKKNPRWSRGMTMAATACAAVVLVAAAVLAKPNLFSGRPASTAPTATVQASAPAAAATTAAPVQTPTPTPAPVATATVDPMLVRDAVQFEGRTGLTAGKGPMMKPMIFVNLGDFAKVAPNIAVLKFVKQLDTIPSDDGRLVYTDYEMQVTQVLKGDLKPGHTVTVQVLGGASDKVWVEDNFVERFTGDFDYVLFLNQFDDNGKTKYQLCSSFQGYVPILNGRVSLNAKIKDNGLYTQGEALDDLITKIKDALK